MRDNTEVVRVYAGTVATDVIDLHPRRNLPPIKPNRCSVRHFRSPIRMKSSVSIGVKWPAPRPALCRAATHDIQPKSGLRLRGEDDGEVSHHLLHFGAQPLQ